MRAIIFAALMLPVPAMAQDLIFDIAPVAACLQSGGGEECVGIAAEACINATPGGYSTVGMGACTEYERAAWDGWLNEVYQALSTKFKAQDAEAPPYAPKQADALREMQLAWIGFRDAKCAYVASQWGGGTGAGPASVSCHLHETARQMLYLQSSQLGE
ncbi:hypothetical protein ROSMUCSMR3_00248 [Roseovarius mucosus]|uniref:Lysozyme inhibitor LprI-like N-terminal domain-containing protein n=1 Tax=Roseovarius mucosus TaxID=215743 RepID=A0A1V0RIZ2_9RHOB|nr:lysozyme inhibitor LprI family protein [Roseovarius mucosus]ARE81757.1 hypothetical protein ROSMUCSMR3_00248 [Roseovarius mucosus]